MKATIPGRLPVFKPTLVLLTSLVIGLTAAGHAAAQTGGERNDASAATKAANERVLEQLPFSNRQDFE
ncbi:MAG: hypothetical protein ACLFWF_13240, partial [Alphaproteobacteria bacterium]